MVQSGAKAGTAHLVDRRPFVIGRHDPSDLVIDDETVSRRHATVEVFGDGRAILRDLGSTNGTFLEGTRIHGAVPLREGQRFRVGDTVLELAGDEAPVAAATVVRTGAAGAAPGAADSTSTPSVVRRLRLERSVRRLTMASVVAAALAIVLVVLLVAGVLPPGDDGDDRVAPEDIVEAVGPATVLVNVVLDGETSSSGSGWVLDADEGLIVTNHHVVELAEEVVVDIGGDQRAAEIVGTAPCEDLTVLRVRDPSGLRPVELGSQEDLRLGQTVVALGFPAGASRRGNLTATTGVVSVVRTRFQLDPVDVPAYPNVVQTDAALNPGNSGGPLVNLQRELVGVNSAGITLNEGGDIIQGQGYAIGVDRVREVLGSLRDGESSGWTGMGIEYPPRLSELTDLDLPPRPGLLVTTALPGSPAADAGFGEAPVLVTAVDGERMDGTLPRYCRVAAKMVSGDEATFSVVAPGRTSPQDVEVGFL